MDPDANWEEQQELIAIMLDEESEYVDSGDSLRLAELVQALNAWIISGGALPSAWRKV